MERVYCSVAQPGCREQVSISSTFYMRLFCQYFGAKKLQSWTYVIREKVFNLLSFEKRAHKMLMKLTPGVRVTSEVFVLKAAVDQNWLKNTGLVTPRCLKVK